VKEAFLAPYAVEFFDRKKILSLLDEHYEGKRNNARKIWVLYTFLVWYRAFFIDFDQYLEREDRA
jgi:asparagine synthase (glutamine-hydrolysing)